MSDAEMLRREQTNETLPKPKIVSVIPQKYQDKETSGITVTIPPKGTNSLQIEISDK
jgi:hypothetical protein